ncbi:MAG: hypothetical protein J4O01_06655, partial [Chloroflexi bacterium]|nr:hypothetical protein [Chloroflexota bacterium]
MRSFRIGCANWGSPFLIALVPLFVLLIVACDDRDGGFKEDPRIANQAASPAPDIEPTPEIQEGRLPGRTHGDRAHGIWPQVWSQHAPSVQSWEYKVNCGDASTHEEACFLSDLTSVVV